MKDPFTRGKAWFIYAKLEREFIETTSYVALETVHEKVWSEKFGELLIRIGSSVGSYFNLMVDSNSLDKEKSITKLREEIETKRQKNPNWSPTITDFRKAFDPVFRLSDAEVEASYGLTYYGILKPFKGFERKTPGWWDAHNKLKHEFFEKLEERAQLQNTINALAGLFLLNIFHKENQQYLIRHSNVIFSEGVGAKEFATRPIKERYLRPSFIGVPKDITYQFYARTQLFNHAFRVDKNITTQQYYSIPH